MRRSGTEFEVIELSFPRGMSREESRRALTARAEVGAWELARLRLYPDGSRRVWLRRRIIRQRAAWAWSTNASGGHDSQL
jgi:Family of unknown function (DUF5703)